MSHGDLDLDDEDTDREMAKSLALQLLAETRRDVKELLRASTQHAERVDALADRVEVLEARTPPSFKRDAGLASGAGAVVFAIWQLASAAGFIRAPAQPAPSAQIAPAPFAPLSP
jgi:hypothetical protein